MYDFKTALLLARWRLKKKVKEETRENLITEMRSVLDEGETPRSERIPFSNAYEETSFMDPCSLDRIDKDTDRS